MMSSIHHITDTSELFPPLLREIPQPPTELYIRGNLDILTAPSLLAVVGSRKATAYGKQAVTKLLPPIINAGVIIVSGLALGIDSIAHRLSVEAGYPTIAILGSGVDDNSIYPRSHLALARQILKTGGAIVSEYPPGSHAYQSTFPERNRIIAGLSHATLIVQAAERSGSLITARLALECNRDVCAIPGQITDPMSAGTNKLIQQGASPILSPTDLFNAMELEEIPATAQPAIKLSTEQTAIASILTHIPTHIDDIIAKTKFDSAKTSILLTELELLDAVQSLGSSRYVKVSLE